MDARAVVDAKGIVPAIVACHSLVGAVSATVIALLAPHVGRARDACAVCIGTIEAGRAGLRAFLLAEEAVSVVGATVALAAAV